MLGESPADPGDPARQTKCCDQLPLQHCGLLPAPRLVTRVFVGRNIDEAATLVLADADGRDRPVLSVAPEGQARIQFLDENGDTVRELVP